MLVLCLGGNLLPQLRPETTTPKPATKKTKKKASQKTKGETPKTTPAQIVVHTSPEAEVYLDDQFEGRAGTEGRVVIANPALGTHKLRVSQTGKRSYEDQVSVTAAQSTEITATLAELLGELRIHTVPGAQVLVDDVNGGSADAEGQLNLSDLAPGSHKFRIVAPGKQDWDSKIEVAAGKTSEVTAALVPNAQARIALGLELRKKGDWDGAIAEYREALRLKPDDAAAHEGLGALLGQKGELDAGIAELRQAIRLKPDHVEAHNNLGWLLGRKGDWEADIAEQREALRLGAKDAWTHRQLGVALLSRHDPDGAIAEYREALRLEPDNPDAHTWLGLALYNKHDLDGAIAEYREALRLRPEDAVAHANLGNALDDKHDLEGAIGELREAVRLKPEYAWARYVLGYVLNEKGDRSSALEQLRLASELEPNNQQIRAAYQRLLAASSGRETGSGPVTVSNAAASFSVRHAHGFLSFFMEDGQLTIENGRLRYTCEKDRGHEFDVSLSDVVDVKTTRGRNPYSMTFMDAEVEMRLRNGKRFAFATPKPREVRDAIQRAMANQ